MTASTVVLNAGGGGQRVASDLVNGVETLVVKSASIPLTAFGDLQVAELTPQFQGSFEYTVSNTEITTNTLVGAGTVTQAEAMAVVASSATASSSACLQSKRHAKYRAGLGGLMRFTTLFTSPVAGTEQFAGILDVVGSTAAFKNGLAVGYDGTTFGYHRFVNDTLVTTAQADWDDPLDGTGASGQIVDHTKLNIWYIEFGYLGALGPILWFIGKDNVAHKVHTMPITGTLTVPTSYNPNYHFTLWASNSAVATNIIVKNSSYAYFIEGDTHLLELHQIHGGSGKQQVTAVTSEVAIFTIRNKEEYASKTNFIDVALEGIATSIEASSASNLGSVRIVRDATLGGTPSWSDINTTDSVVEIDTAGTTVTGGKELLFVDLSGKNDRENQNVSSYDIILAPNESLTVAGLSANNATINAAILWKELF